MAPRGRRFALRSQIDGGCQLAGELFDYWLPLMVRTTLFSGRVLFTDSLSCWRTISSYFASGARARAAPCARS